MHVAADVSDIPAASDKKKLNTRQLLSLSLFWFPINMFWTVILTFFLPERVEQIVGDVHKGQYLAIITPLGGLATTVIQLIIAPLSDRCAAKWGRRHPFILLGTVACAVCNVGFAIAGNFPLLLVSFFGIQLFLNAAIGPYQALIPDNVPVAQQGLASAYMGGANLLGQLLAAGLNLALLQPRGPLSMAQMIYLVTGLLLAGMVATLLLVPDRPATPQEQHPDVDPVKDMLDWQIRENPDFYHLLGSRFFINLSYYTVVAFVFYYLKDSLALGQEAGKYLQFVLLAVTVAALVGTISVGKFIDRVSKKSLIYGACAILALATTVFCFTNSFTWVLGLAVIFGIGWGAFSAVDWAMATNLLPKGGAAKYMAVWHVCMTVPQMIAPVFGAIADPINKNPHYGHGLGWRAAMLSTVIYLVIGAVWLRHVREHPNKRKEAVVV